LFAAGPASCSGRCRTAWTTISSPSSPSASRWTTGHLKELTGHYVNYRKQVSDRGALLPEIAFGLFAICARTPRELFQAVVPETIQPGVYVCRRGSDTIRIVVAADLPKTEHNALLHLFSASADRVQYGAEHYRLTSPDLSTIVNKLFASYRQEGLTMPYTMSDFRREVALEVLDQLTPEQRLRGLPPEELAKRLPPEERLRGLPPEERLRGLPPEELAKRLTPEQRLAGLSPEQIETYLKRQRKSKSGQAKKGKPKR
jgi:hypothetical protein